MAVQTPTTEPLESRGDSDGVTEQTKNNSRIDEESHESSAKAHGDVAPPTLAPGDDDLGFEDNTQVPKLSYLKLFWFFFYNFGLFAWGGPVAQIALIKERLVVQDKWITLPRFQRVFSVYQILPGPEAAELCMFFGCLSAGRIGGIIAGIAFILPGFVLMLAASYLYSLAGFENKYFNASFRALQPVVAAMVSNRHPSEQKAEVPNIETDSSGHAQDRRALCQEA
jgi:hypothetical protein